jgi:hypothetical protein
MARARLRTSQFRDADVMSEAEHDSWIHINTVVSGALTLSGTSGKIDLTTNGTDLLVNGAAISGSGGGTASDTLYYSGSERVEAVNDGAKVTGDLFVTGNDVCLGPSKAGGYGYINGSTPNWVIIYNGQN